MGGQVASINGITWAGAGLLHITGTKIEKDFLEIALQINVRHACVCLFTSAKEKIMSTGGLHQKWKLPWTVI